MPVSVYHSKTATTPDNTTAEVRPSHWNESHVVSLALAGNEVIKYIGAGGSSQSTGTIQFSNSNGLSFGLNNGILTGSHNGITSQSQQTQGIQSISAGGTRVTGGELVFSNSNGLAFGINGQTVTGSYTVPTQSAQSVGVYASSQTTGQSSSSTVDARSLSFAGAGGVSVGMSGGSIIISGATGGGAGDGYNILAAGTQTAATATTVQFANSNGISFGMSGSAQITASHNALTSQSGQAISAANGSSAFQTLSFGDSNGVSFSVSNGSIVASVAATQSNQTLGLYAVSNTVAGASSSATFDARTVSIKGAGIASVGYSNGSLVISVPAGGGVGDGGNVLIAGTQTATSLGSVLFANSNGISFGMSGSTQITASYTVPTQTNQTLGLYAVSNTIQSSSGTVDARTLSFQGAGIASVGISNGSVIVSVPAGGGVGDGGNVIIAGTQTATTLGSVFFADSNGISFGLSGSTRLTASHNGLTSQSNQAASAANGSFAFQTLSFSNLNGVSFGTSAGSAITASVAAQTNQTVGAYAVSNTTQSSSGTIDARSLSFQGAGNVSIGVSNGSVVVSGGGGAGAGLSAGTQSVSTGTVVFSNSNGISFGMSGSSRITASFSQSIQTIGVYGSSNTTGASSSSTYDARSMSLVGYGIISIGQSNGSIQISAPDAVDFTQLSVGFSTGGNTAGTTGLVTGQMVLAGGANITLSGSTNGNSLTVSIVGGAGGGGAGISAGTQSVSTGTVVFSNSNNITFGMSGSSRITASFSQTNQTVGLYALGNTTQNSSTTLDARTLSFNALGAMTAGYSNGSIQLSAPATSSLSATGAVSLSTNGSTISIGVPQLSFYASSNTTAQSSSSSFSLGSVTLRGAGGVSVGFSGSEIVISGAAGGGGSVNLSAGTTSNNLTNFVFSNSNGVSFGLNGSTVTASVALTSQSNQAASASNGSFAFQTLGFSNANGVTFGTSAGSIISASIATSLTGVNLSAGTTSNNLSAFVFSNSNNISFGLNGSTVTASASAQSNQTLGLYAVGNTTQNSSTTLDARTISFNGLGAITAGFSNGSVQISAPATSSLSATGAVSISTNGSTISIGVPNQFTQSGYEPYGDSPLIISQVGQASLLVDPQVFPNVQFDRVLFPIYNTNSTLSSGSHTLSFWVGLYTQNVSTLSLVGSTSNSTALTHSGTVGSYSLYSGMRLFSIGSTTTLTAGQYWMAFVSRTTSGGADGSYSNAQISNIGSSFLGYFGSSANASRQFTLGQGFYSATTSGMPASIGFSQLVGSDPNAQQQQVFMFASSTI